MDKIKGKKLKNIIQLKILETPRDTARKLGKEQPLRAELFSIEQMMEFAKNMASRHEIEKAPVPDRLLSRLSKNEKLLLDAYQLLQDKEAKKFSLRPAEEWFLDNFYLIEEQIRLTRKHLPKSYSRELPSLKTGKFAGFPRVYDMALEVISHGDGKVDAGSISAFVEAYQEKVCLKLGELWAVPIMLRLALIENLRRVAARITAGRIDRKLADDWAVRMAEVAEKDPKNLVVEMAEMARSEPPLSSAFVAELARQLQGQGPSLALPLTWIEQRLREEGLSIEQQVRLENQRQAEDQVSVSNSISSLRFLYSMDWREFVEAMSRVEQILSRDPMETYHRADFKTRDRCRHKIEALSKKSGVSEEETANKVLGLARKAAEAYGNNDRRSHVGYYLIDNGSDEAEEAVFGRVKLFSAVRRFIKRRLLFFYMAATVILAAVFAGVMILQLPSVSPLFTACAALLLVISAWHPALAMINWAAHSAAKPSGLARMDYSKGLPPEARTLIVIPCMLTGLQAASRLLENIEVLYLANRDPYIHFGLVTDFKDAPQEKMEEDKVLLAAAIDGIEKLNKLYRPGQKDLFYLFHRGRQWNPGEKCWMGKERKRGKLHNLNSFILNEPVEQGTLVIGEVSVISQVRYVITLDENTQLPLDAARELAATMAHPLNTPLIDEKDNRVYAGYGVLQPRVGKIMSTAPKSWFAGLFGGEQGIDPYTLAVSDTYQDLFREGSFVGKGIYDVAVFQKVLANRFPENRILSHDLLEGGYIRSGLVSDVVLYEDFPEEYLSDCRRRHRWIRGDWQIARWLFPVVPGEKGRLKNPLNMLYRWKIFDNLRRSLTAPAITALLILAWAHEGAAVLITSVVLAVYFIPPAASALASLIFQKPRDLLFSIHLRDTFRGLARQQAKAFLKLAFLPFEAFLNLDAVLRTRYRLWISRKKLLSWKTSQDASGAALAAFNKILKEMWAAPALSAVLMAAVIMTNHALPAAATAVLALWFFSPLLAWHISRAPKQKTRQLSEEQEVFLHGLSRRTWRFFEVFVTEADHWLPPDNFQEKPAALRAHRTSPTNIGLALLANLSAYDFGYICAGELARRTKNTFDTMETLERFRGHFYNWYDTVTLAPLEPRYISSVDSGNLAGHLLVLRQGLLDLAGLSIAPAAMVSGCADTFGIFEEEAGREGLKISGELKEKTAVFKNTLKENPRGIRKKFLQLKKLNSLSAELIAAAGANPSAAVWINSVEKQLREHADDMFAFAPWLAMDEPEEAFWQNVSSEEEGRLMERLRLSWQRVVSDITLREASEMEETLAPLAENLKNLSGPAGRKEWIERFLEAAAKGAKAARERILQLEGLARKCRSFADIEYDFLYDYGRHLMAIGYHAGERRRDEGFYDLLASEARLGSFTAIAQGRLPQEHWFSLGRSLTKTGGMPVLLSWSGSMFEYLMPLLVMPSYKNTLLDRTYKAVVAGQIEYGRNRDVFWGVSESGYNTTDVNRVYQYRAFGVPGMGFKRGLSDDLVIAPYASALALMVEPASAAENLQAMASAGILGEYGLFEAVDYTQARLSRGQDYAVVNSYMSHHQGMVLLSLAYCLLGQPMQKRFEIQPEFRAASLLLHERVPRVSPAFPHAFETLERHWQEGQGRESLMRVFNTPHTPVPEVHLLSNGRYHVMVTQAGGGYSRWQDLSLTRWREDATQDKFGFFCYIKDVERNETWSAAFHPVKKEGKHYEAIFSQARAEFRRRDFDIDTHTEIAVSPEDDIELRRVRITNRTRTARTLEITSYTEVVLAPAAAEETHPAFNNLFIETEIIRGRSSILATRRPRSKEDLPPWMLHLMIVRGAEEGAVSFETDRTKFIGRGNTSADGPVKETGPLSDSEGTVLDPVLSIRRRIVIEPEGTVVVNMVMGAAQNRETALALIEKYHDWRLADRVFELAFSHGRAVLHQLNATDEDAQVFGSIAGSIVFANPASRAQPGVILKNNRGQTDLWSYGISGDHPIVLLRIADPANIEMARRVAQAHAYWRLNGLAADLIIWNEDAAGYRDELQDKITGLISTGLEAHALDRPGGIFVRRIDQIPEEDRVLMQAAARVIITDRGGTLEEQVSRRAQVKFSVPSFAPYRARRVVEDRHIDLTRRDLIYFNGLGGFTSDGREYITTTTAEQMTPRPWSNVMANPDFGTVVSESGSSYTFSENAHEFRLTPWHNDAVSDPGGEAFYIRDEESGRYWSPAPFPVRGARPYACRHGFGYTVFEYRDFGIESELTTTVATDAPVKFWILKLKNISSRPRRLTVTGYAEWVLGELRSKTLMHVVTEIDGSCNALFARNPFNTEFPGRTAFFDVNDPKRSYTGDRAEFIGRNGTLKNPAVMGRTRLSNRTGPAMDPCGGLQTAFELAEGEEKEIVFMMGAGKNADEARGLVQRFRGNGPARGALERVWNHWSRTLSGVYVETPDRKTDILTNGWLMYQVIACRLWARSGYYQSGGAFGFRDQLQDVLAVIHTNPGLTRQHLLRCAERQFPEGDVQHWWHPPLGRGVRTRCSDDYLWLPYAVCDYTAKTGDTGVLDEIAGFIQGRELKPDEESYYDLPFKTDEKAGLYEHCRRAVMRGLRFGSRGLPLMEGGDWNDGMNLVGAQGKGESVWLAFFLYSVLVRFGALARSRRDIKTADICVYEAARLKKNISTKAWDGGWWIRAFFDSGEPLGSAENAECRIDSLPQSWSVLSGAGEPARSRASMEAVEKHLVKPGTGIIQLFDPPFDMSAQDPGYIRGYAPGVRENGGQYTHAAAWAVMAMAELGEAQKAWDWLDRINPISRGSTHEGMERYKTEPYVMAGDVYSREPYSGRGGWSWYTGSAGWVYQCITESLLGLKLEVDKLIISPRWPAGWENFKVHYRFRETVYHINVIKSDEPVSRVAVDSNDRAEPFLRLADDRQEHWVDYRCAKK